MAQNNGPLDDKLIEELYKKLNWFTFQASDEEFDADQVKAILKLLDTLDPLSDTMELQKSGQDFSEVQGESEKMGNTDNQTVS